MDTEERRSKEKLCIGILIVGTLLLILGSLESPQGGITFSIVYVIMYVSGFFYYGMISHRLDYGRVFKIILVMLSYLLAASSASLLFLFKGASTSLEGNLYTLIYLILFSSLTFALIPGIYYLKRGINILKNSKNKIRSFPLLLIGVFSTPAFFLPSPFESKLGLATVIIFTLIITWIITYFYLFMIPRKRLIALFKKQKLLIKEKNRSYNTSYKIGNEEKFKEEQAMLKEDQIELRKQILKLVKDMPHLKTLRYKKVREKQEKDIRRAPNRYSEGDLSRRAWLFGFSSLEAKNLFDDLKDKYADKVQELREEDLPDEEIKVTLMEEHGFTEYRASTIMNYSEKREEIRSNE